MKKKLFIGVPVYGQIDANFHCSMRLLERENPLHDLIVYESLGDSLVSRARNHITRQFLESDCTDLLFIDSDLTFSTDHVRRIMSHNEDVVGGSYFKKCEGEPLGVWNLFPEVEFLDNGLVNAKYVGTGFMRIRRKVFELMIQEFGKDIWYTLDHDCSQKEYNFWGTGVYEFPDKTRRYLSEDWWFCQKWLDIGGKVRLDRGIILKHTGMAIYPLKDQEQKIFKRVLPAKAGESLDKPAEALSAPAGELSAV